jgi:hypothetical protein
MVFLVLNAGLGPGPDYRTQKEDKSYAEDAENKNYLEFIFATSAKPLRPLRPVVRISQR